MAHVTRMLGIGIVILSLGAVGCAPKWSEIHKAQEREAQNYRAWVAQIAPLLQPPSGNAGEAAHVAYQVRLAYIGQTLHQMRPDTLQTVLAYAKSRDEALYRYLSLALNNSITDAAAKAIAGGVGDSGGNTFEFGGKGSENNFSNFDFTTGNQSPFVAGSDNATASDDGQIIDGEGNTQGQAVSRPNTQNDLDFAGDGGGGDESPGGASDNNVDSEGLGSGTTLGIE